MDFRQWQSRLLSELQKRNVPPSYGRRLLRELQEHVLDLQEVDMNCGMEAKNAIDYSQRLGDPAQLAEQAAAAGVYPTWAGRHPWLALLVGAPVLFLLSVCGLVLLAIGMASLVEGRTVATTPGLTQVCWWAGSAIAFVPAVAVSLLLCRMVAASGRRRLWALAACSLVAVLAGGLVVSCTPPQIEPGTGRLAIGVGAGSAWQLAQAIGPLLIGVVFVAMGRLVSQRIEDDLGSRPVRSAA